MAILNSEAKNKQIDMPPMTTSSPGKVAQSLATFWQYLSESYLLSPRVERIHTSNFQVAAIFANHQKNSFQKLNARRFEVWLFWSICCCCAAISNTARPKMRLSFVSSFATPLSCVHVSVFASISQINSQQSHITRKTLNSR